MNSATNTPPPEVINAIIGQQIRGIREHNGLTINAVELATGISAKQLEHFEMGKDNIPADSLFKLAEFFKVSPNYFFEGLMKHLPGRDVSNADIHQLIQNFLKVDNEDRGALFKNFVKAVTGE